MAAALLTVERRRAARDNRVEFFTNQAEDQALFLEQYVAPENCLGQNRVKACYDSTVVQVGVAGLIFLNFIVEASAAQILPEDDTDGAFVFFVFELFFNISFTIELIVNLYGSWFTKFWMSGWNLFDFLIVGISLVAMLFPAFPGITVLRLFRAFRVFRLFKRIPSLRKIIEGVLKSIPGVSQAFVVMFILMGIWSVIGVEFFRNATPQEFGDFLRAMFTMFQVMTMDFSGIARTIMFDHDYPLASIFFITFIFICGIVMTNVVVAILLDQYLASMDDADADDAKSRGKALPTIYLEVDSLLKPIRRLSWNDWEKVSRLLNQFPTARVTDSIKYGSRNVVNIEEWTVDDVGSWLKSIGFDDYISEFGEDAIKGKWLMRIKEYDLRLFGMKHGRRKEFMHQLYKLIMEQTERLDQLESLKNIFDEYDENGNGLIDTNEFLEVWKKYFANTEIPEDEVLETLKELDTSGDGNIDFAEFVDATSRLQKGKMHDDTSEIFNDAADSSEGGSSFDEGGVFSFVKTEKKETLKKKWEIEQKRRAEGTGVPHQDVKAGFHGDHANLMKQNVRGARR